MTSLPVFVLTRDKKIVHIIKPSQLLLNLRHLHGSPYVAPYRNERLFELYHDKWNGKHSKIRIDSFNHGYFGLPPPKYCHLDAYFIGLIISSYNIQLIYKIYYRTKFIAFPTDEKIYERKNFSLIDMIHTVQSHYINYEKNYHYANFLQNLINNMLPKSHLISKLFIVEYNTSIYYNNRLAVAAKYTHSYLDKYSLHYNKTFNRDDFILAGIKIKSSNAKIIKPLKSELDYNPNMIHFNSATSYMKEIYNLSSLRPSDYEMWINIIYEFEQVYTITLAPAPITQTYLLYSDILYIICTYSSFIIQYPTMDILISDEEYEKKQNEHKSLIGMLTNTSRIKRIRLA